MVTFVSSTTEHNSSANSRTLSEPASCQENDLLITFCSLRNDEDNQWDTVTDWTRLFSVFTTADAFNTNVAVFYRFRPASAVTGVTFSNPGSANPIRVTMASYRGVDTAGPLEVVFSAANHIAEYTDDSVSAAEDITTVTDAAKVLLFQFTSQGPISTPGAPSGYDLDVSATGVFNRNQFIASIDVATAGTETPGVWTHTGTSSSADSFNATIALSPEPTGPIIDSVSPDPMVEGSTVTIDGSGFKPSTTDPTVDWGAESQTVDTASDTSIDITPVLGDSLYGVATEISVTNSDSESVESDAAYAMEPASTEDYQDLTQTLATSGQRITAIPDLVVGSQVHFKNLEDSSATSQSISLLTVNPDGSLSIDGSVSLPATFDVRGNNDDGEGWGAFAEQTVNDQIDLDIEAGTFASTGQDISLAIRTILDIESATITLDNKNIGLGISGFLTVDAAELFLTGQDVGLDLGNVLDIESSAFSLTGEDTDLAFPFSLDIESGTLTFAGNNITLGQAPEPGAHVASLDWIRAATEKQGSWNDLWMQYLRSLGYSGSLNDMMFEWLEDEGFPGALSDKMAAWIRQNLSPHI